MKRKLFILFVSLIIASCASAKEQIGFRNLRIVPENQITRTDMHKMLVSPNEEKLTVAIWIMSLYSDGNIDVYKLNRLNVFLFLKYDRNILKEAYFLFL